MIQGPSPQKKKEYDLLSISATTKLAMAAGISNKLPALIEYSCHCSLSGRIPPGTEGTARGLCASVGACGGRQRWRGISFVF